jgi:hypothetical protein
MTTNLDAKCREHHRLKTFHTGCDGWRDTQPPDGTIEWTSPTGRIYRSTPDGAELFDDIADACTPRNPQGRNHRRDKTRRTAAARAAMAAKRSANAETLRINRARAQEIDERKWRNNFRNMLFLFKAHPAPARFAPGSTTHPKTKPSPPTGNHHRPRPPQTTTNHPS